MADHLAQRFGTEKDRVNCPFYIKIGCELPPCGVWSSILYSCLTSAVCWRAHWMC